MNINLCKRSSESRIESHMFWMIEWLYHLQHFCSLFFAPFSALNWMRRMWEWITITPWCLWTVIDGRSRCSFAHRGDRALCIDCDNRWCLKFQLPNMTQFLWDLTVDIEDIAQSYFRHVIECFVPKTSSRSILSSTHSTWKLQVRTNADLFLLFNSEKTLSIFVLVRG